MATATARLPTATATARLPTATATGTAGRLTAMAIGMAATAGAEAITTAAPIAAAPTTTAVITAGPGGADRVARPARSRRPADPRLRRERQPHGRGRPARRAAGRRRASRIRGCCRSSSAPKSQLRARLTLYPARLVEPRRFCQSLPWASVFALVLERDLELGAIGLDLAVVDHQILLDDLGDAQVPEAQRGALDCSPGGPLPRFLARADQLDHFINGVGHTFLLRLVIRAGRRKTMRGPDRRPDASHELAAASPSRSRRRCDRRCCASLRPGLR